MSRGFVYHQSVQKQRGLVRRFWKGLQGLKARDEALNLKKREVDESAQEIIEAEALLSSNLK